MCHERCSLQVKGVVDDFESKVTAAIAKTKSNLKATEVPKDEPTGVEVAPSK
jgi:hypothetical protein